ncbi:MAG: hypothetical protein LBK54_06010 [Propionibacteriaceae bacterium]|jgi:hypothetical protein|nr:hypothetical protein [Propionibacteriaceae bacterium]
MSSTEHILVSGATSLAELVRLAGIDGEPEVMAGGLVFDQAMAADAELVGYYEDDRGLPLSRYRFDLWSENGDRRRWASAVYALLAAKTDFDLLWVVDLEEVRASRPALVAA